MWFWWKENNHFKHFNTKSHSVESTISHVRVVTSRVESCRNDNIFHTPSTTTSNTLVLSPTLTTWLFHMSGRHESCRVVSTWRQFSYPAPLHSHFKHLNTKYHSDDLTISHVESWRVATSRVDLTTFFIPPSSTTSNTLILRPTLLTRPSHMSSRDKSCRLDDISHTPSTTTSSTLKCLYGQQGLCHFGITIMCKKVFYEKKWSPTF